MLNTPQSSGELLPWIVAHAKEEFDKTHPPKADVIEEPSLTKTESAKDNVEDVVGDNTPGDAPEASQR